MPEIPERAMWRKVYLAVFTSPSHIDLDPQSLLVIVLCIVAATWDGKSSAAEVLDDAGNPMAWTRLAKLAHMSLGRFRKAVRDASAPDVGTLVVEGTRIVIPKFRRWQEAPSTARTRKHRDKRRSSVTVTVTETRRGTEEEEEAEEEAEEDPQTPVGAPAVLSTPQPDPKAELRKRAESIRVTTPVSHGLHHELDMHRRALDADLGKLPNWAGKGSEVAEGMARALEDVGTIDTLRAVIRHSAERYLAGELDEKFWRLMWRGAGFGAHLRAWRESTGAVRHQGTTADDVRRVLSEGA